MKEDLFNTDELIVEKAPLHCAQCGARLCLRKQVINLSLGNAEEMLCLVCLSNNNSKAPQEVLSQMRAYVVGRQCFRNQWLKYRNESYCPEPDNCFPDICFEE